MYCYCQCYCSVPCPTQPPVEETQDGEAGQEEEEVFEIPKTPQPKEWVCLGSDVEIMETHVHTTRPLVRKNVCYYNPQLMIDQSLGPPHEVER